MIEENVIKVGMADMNVAVRENDVLKTTGLGSCVGVVMYDPFAKISGMAHIMLPTSEIARQGPVNPAKYADTAIPELLRLMRDAGADVRRMVAKLAGGAQMFAFSGPDTMRIGPRNVEECKEQLGRLGIPIVAEDTGKNFGRTIEFCNANGLLTVRSVQQGVKQL